MEILNEILKVEVRLRVAVNLLMLINVEGLWDVKRILLEELMCISLRDSLIRRVVWLILLEDVLFGIVIQGGQVKT